MSKSKALVALDPATITGWVYLGFNKDHDGPMYLQHGEYTMKTHRFEGAGMGHLRYRGWLQQLLETSKPDACIFEEVPAHKGVDAAHVYGALTSIIMQVCEELEVPYGAVAIATWKRLATGTGNANKIAIAKAFGRLHGPVLPGTQPWGQDAIDAFYIGWAGADQLGWCQ